MKYRVLQKNKESFLSHLERTQITNK